MKKFRIITLIMAACIVVCSTAGCKGKEFSEVHTKISNEEVAFLSQDKQLVTVEITIKDGTYEVKFEKEIRLNSDEVSFIKLNDIINDQNDEFFTSEARIEDVTILNQNVDLYDIFAGVLIVGLLVCWFAMLLC